MPRWRPLCARLGLLLAQRLVADVRERLVEVGVVVAAVVGEAGGHVVTVVELRNEVLPPHLDGVLADLGGEAVDQPLEHVGGLGAAGAAVGLDRRGVRVDAVDVLVHVRDEVGPAQHEAVEDRRDARRSGRQVGAHAGPDRTAHAGDRSVGSAAHLDVLHVIAAVGRGDVVLRCASRSTSRAGSASSRRSRR